MNTREAMQALLDGKKIRHNNWCRFEYVHFSADGEVVDEEGNSYCLGPGLQYELFVEPNPHPKGTFAWAREEAKRGRIVRRPQWPRNWSFMVGGAFSLADIDATDWEYT